MNRSETAPFCSTMLLRAALSIALLLLGAGLWSELGPADEGSPTHLTPGLEESVAHRLLGLALPLPKPGPMDWLTEHPEDGQTFDEYVTSDPPLPTAKRRVLYVAPLGPFTYAEQELLLASCEFLGLYYSLPVVRLDPVALDDLPGRATRSPGVGFGPQVHSGWILRRELVPRLPEDGVALIGLTAQDLWPGEGWNFVFGQADLKRRVGVWSLARYGDPSESEEARLLALGRALGVASHETGHMLGLHHCTAWHCNMNGSNHLAESDAQPLHLCPVCTAKVTWATGAEPAERANRLGLFAERVGLPRDEQIYWRACADLLTKPASY